MSNSFKESGYDLEERFFHKSEIEKIKSIRDARSATKKASAKELHWMKCPKCGSQMDEVHLEGILIDKCSGCDGVYFDQGELELLMKHRQSDSFFSKIDSLYK